MTKSNKYNIRDIVFVITVAGDVFIKEIEIVGITFNVTQNCFYYSYFNDKLRHLNEDRLFKTFEEALASIK